MKNVYRNMFLLWTFVLVWTGFQSVCITSKIGLIQVSYDVGNLLNTFIFLVADKVDPCKLPVWFWHSFSPVQSPGVEFSNKYVLLFVQYQKKINLLQRNVIHWFLQSICSVCTDQLWCPLKKINTFPDSCLFSIGIKALELFFEATGLATLRGYQYTEHLKRRRLPKQKTRSILPINPLWRLRTLLKTVLSYSELITDKPNWLNGILIVLSYNCQSKQV